MSSVANATTVKESEIVKVPKITKEMLRRASFLALTDDGFTVSLVNGPGIVPGAQLKTEKKGEEPRTISVRTSLDREVGLLRQRNGKKWRTISRVDEVVVAVPDTEDASKIEVFGFDPDVLIAVFDAAMEGRKQSINAHKAPLFVPLDRVRKSAAGNVIPALKSKALWRKVVPLEQLSISNAPSKNSAALLIDNFKRELAAELNAKEVRVEITIVK
jgi:hypothetical protein